VIHLSVIVVSRLNRSAMAIFTGSSLARLPKSSTLNPRLLNSSITIQAYFMMLPFWYSDTLMGTAYGNDRYITVDRRGHIQISESELLIHVRRLGPDNSLEFLVSAGAADTIDLEASNDLTHWVTVLSVPRAIALSSALRPEDSSNSSHCFYRAASR